MRDFDTLTAPGQVQRLAQVARTALVQYDMPYASVKALATSFNTLFRVRWRGQSFVCRVAPRIGVHAVGVDEAERAWTTRMAAVGAAVPVVVPTADGAASAVVALDGVPGPRTCSLLTWMPGRSLSPPGHTISNGDAADLGRLAAHLHVLGRESDTLPDGVLDGRSVLTFKVEDRLGDLRARYGGLFDTARDQAQAAVTWCWTHGGPPQVHHGDLTWSNVVRGRGRLSAVDCQDLTWSTIEQDLAATLYSVTSGGTDDALLEPFRRGYSSRGPLPDIPPDTLKGLLVARRLQMVNLALNLGRPALGDYLDRHAASLRA